MSKPLLISSLLYRYSIHLVLCQTMQTGINNTIYLSLYLGSNEQRQKRKSIILFSFSFFFYFFFFLSFSLFAQLLHLAIHCVICLLENMHICFVSRFLYLLSCFCWYFFMLIFLCCYTLTWASNCFYHPPASSELFVSNTGLNRYHLVLRSYAVGKTNRLSYHPSIQILAIL